MKKEIKTLTLKERLIAPTPILFKKIRKVGLILGGIGAALLTAPITLPVVLTSIAGYLVTAGLVASAIAQTTVPEQSSVK